MTSETPSLFAEPAESPLELLFAVSNRKTAFKALSPERRLELEQAVGVVARAKALAYDLARQGAPRNSFGWLNNSPDTAQACATLHSALLDINAIAMAEA